jgi:GGDEF domain-containing protein
VLRRDAVTQTTQMPPAAPLSPAPAAGLEAGRFVPDARRHPVWDRLLELPRGRAVGLVLAGVVLTFGVDVATPVEMSFSLLYLVPIAVATWSIDRRAGVGVGVACSILIYLWERFGAFPYSSTFFLDWAFFVHLGFYGAFAWTFAALRATYLRSKIDTLRDAETGLYNRRAFYDAVAVEARRATRFSRSLTLAAFDVGAPVTPARLQRLTAALSASRLYDVAARVGPGRFVLLLPETGAEAGRITIDRVRREAGLDGDGAARVGLVTFEWPPTCVDDLLREADRVMTTLHAQPAPALRHVVLRGASATPAPSGRLSRA